MDLQITPQATFRAYGKTYTITFYTVEGLARFAKESKAYQAYGTKMDFIRLATTRDAKWFSIRFFEKA